MSDALTRPFDRHFRMPVHGFPSQVDAQEASHENRQGKNCQGPYPCKSGYNYNSHQQVKPEDQRVDPEIKGFCFHP